MAGRFILLLLVLLFVPLLIRCSGPFLLISALQLFKHLRIFVCPPLRLSSEALLPLPLISKNVAADPSDLTGHLTGCQTTLPSKCLMF
jgi:hypothetical protein